MYVHTLRTDPPITNAAYDISQPDPNLSPNHLHIRHNHNKHLSRSFQTRLFAMVESNVDLIPPPLNTSKTSQRSMMRRSHVDSTGDYAKPGTRR